MVAATDAAEASNIGSPAIGATPSAPASVGVVLVLLVIVFFFGGSLPAYNLASESFGPATTNLGPPAAWRPHGPGSIATG